MVWGQEVKKTAKAVKSHERVLPIARTEVSYNSFSNKLQSSLLDVF